MRHFLSRFANLFRSSRLDDDMDEEIRLHIEFETERNVEKGMDPIEAAYAARRSFGGIEQMKEAERDARSFSWIEGLIRDFQYALRGLSNRPGFTTVVVTSLALAIGVNVAMFSIVNSLFIRSLIPDKPEEVVNILTSDNKPKPSYRLFSYAEFDHLRADKEVFSDVAAYCLAGVGVAQKAGEPMQRSFAFLVSDNYLSMLGTQPFLGRFFLPEEGKPDAEIPVVVISHALWKELGSPKDISNLNLWINGRPWQVIGVTPESFVGTNAILSGKLWLPTGMASSMGEPMGQGGGHFRLSENDQHELFLIGRKQANLTSDQIAARLPLLASQLDGIASDADQGARMLHIEKPSRFAYSSEPISDGPMPLFAGLLMLMSGVVLLVACLNLTNMFLARSVSRYDELAVRSSLGASRGQLIRLLLVEGIVVSLLGGALGIIVGYLGNTLLLRSLMSSLAFSSLGLNIALNVQSHGIVLLTTLVFCLLATLMFAVGPALHATRQMQTGDTISAEASRGSTARWGRFFSGRHSLLMLQLALSLTLLFSAGLFMRAAYNASRLDLGFQSQGDLVAELDFSLFEMEKEEIDVRLQNCIRILEEQPMITNIGLASHIPFGGISSGINVIPVEHDADEEPLKARAKTSSVSRNYFTTIGIPLLQGRDFTQEEWRNPQSARVVIIDELLARQLFPKQNPLGKHLRQSHGADKEPGEPMEIVGVVASYRDGLFEEQLPARLFFPFAQGFNSHAYIHMRSRNADPESMHHLQTSVRENLLKKDSQFPVIQIIDLDTFIDGNIELWVIRMVALLFAVFGAIALLLAIVGVYGVKTFMAQRRIREMGIRMALGARSQQVLSLMVKQGATQILVSLLLGILLSLAMGRLLSGMLLRVSPHDPLILIAVTIPLALTALLATWLPARRATRIHPMTALRTD